jgi:enterochelin esterase-like enzyme
MATVDRRSVVPPVTRAFRHVDLRRWLVGLLSIGFVAVGLVGAYSYWQSYYQHRGFADVPRLPTAGVGQRLTVDFYSPALRRQADYRVFLPPGYDPTAHHYPVFYLLHGSPGRPQVFNAIGHIYVRLENLISEHRIRPMILVFPDGRIRGSTFSDSEWANTPSGNFESYAVEVVHDVDQRFATLARRQDRVIAGFSAGAYGAINVALHNLSVFGSLQVWSGYFRQSRSGVFAHASRAVLAANSPIDYVASLKAQLATYPLRAFLFVGRGDLERRKIGPMTDALRSAGAHARYAIFPGGHDWQLWNGRVDEMLILASHDVAPPRPARSSAVHARREATAAKRRRASRFRRQRALHRRQGSQPQLGLLSPVRPA